MFGERQTPPSSSSASGSSVSTHTRLGLCQSNAATDDTHRHAVDGATQAIYETDRREPDREKAGSE